MIPRGFLFVGVEDTSRTILTIPLLRFSGRLQVDGGRDLDVDELGRVIAENCGSVTNELQSTQHGAAGRGFGPKKSY